MSFRKRSLIIALVALAIVFLLWNTPQLSILLFPFRLFVTFVHEAGHGLAAIATGGRFISFAINPDGSGIAYTAGGAREIILPAGYLGAALFGSLLFYATNTVPYPRQISLLLGGVVILIAVMFGGLLSLATIMGVVMGILLIALGLRANPDINIFALNMLAMLTGLNAVLDLFFLIDNSGASVAGGAVRNDAAAFQQQFTPLLPAALCAMTWAGLAIAMVGTAVYFSVIHPLRRRE